MRQGWWPLLASVWLLCGSSGSTWNVRAAPASSDTPPLPGSIAELLDFRSIPRPKPWTTLQASGYDRGGGFYDSGNFLRVEPGRRFVMMTCDGPGVIDRLWFTSKGEIGSEPYDLLVYLDNPEQPVIQINLDELFSGRREPFIEPLAGRCGNPKFPARYSYVPIGFTRSAKVVLQPTAPPERYQYRKNSSGETIPHVYYQVTYRRLPQGAAVRRFTWDLDPAERDALTRWKSLGAQAGNSPWPTVPGGERSPVSLEIKPGGTGVLFRRDAPGVLNEVRLQTDHPEALEILAAWDGASEPAVAAPFGPFFGCAEALPRAEVRGLWVGFADGTSYNYLPMPFQRSARLWLRSSAKEPVRVSGSVAFLSAAPHPEDLPLHARRYDYAPPLPGQDYVVLDVRGTGHFAGLVMDRPGHMEGDDRFFVDDEATPSLHGTGTEDFFNFAWGLSHTAARPMHGITRQAGGPVAYRFHLPAGVPFRKSLRITWEHGHDPKGGLNLDQSRYSGVVFFYKR